MITPDSTDDKGDDVWADYYEYAEALAVAARGEKAKSGSEVTVKSYVDANSKTAKGRTVSYDPSFADTKLADFAGNATSLRAFSMKVLRMVNFDKADRDLNMRMANQKEITGTKDLKSLVATNPQDMQSKSYWTPALNCIYNVRDAQTKLNATMNVEIKEGMGAIDG